ncbi:MAG: ATP-binding protein [Clostridia bacterium]|nr:ATP-binding protein [Clostridia bacterium]
MIGRKNEQEELLRRYERNKAEFVAVYGRRRVGKTTLITETFQNRFAFHHAGLTPVESEQGGRLHDPAQSEVRRQLKHFYRALIHYGLPDGSEPSSWLEAFYLLEDLLEQKDDGSRQVVFLDELPWMDTPRSGFLTALEGFWNSWGCLRKNLMLIVCGSASSWMMDKLVNNHGGLYNRVTCEIRLAPFSLCECRQFLLGNGMKMTSYDLAECYMVFGGIPFYLDALNEKLSLAQNIDRLFFERNAMFRDEFDRLFNSIFVNPETMKSIVRLLNRRRGGYTRKEISEFTGLSGKTLTSCMRALIGSDFVEYYVPFLEGKREAKYRLIDPFCLFFLRFVEDQPKRNEHFWVQHQASHAITAWRGLAFENVCFFHIPQIKRALGITGVRSSQSAWILRDEAESTQIDLLIERDDRIINACEIKFYSDEFVVDKTYYRKLLSRQGMLVERISPKVSVHQTLISTYGLKRNEYSGVFTQVITLDDLLLE